MKKHFLSIILLSVLSVAEGFSWGQKGHDTTCAVAQNHMSRKALASTELLLDGYSIIYWSNWLDNASNTPEYAYSKTWHFKNVDADQTYDEVEPAETGDVVVALKDNIEKLKNYQIGLISRDEAVLALKMVIHLMGDLHQPMHMGHKSDLGGNRVEVNFFKNTTNLHSVWDSQLLESGHKWSHTEWVEEIDRGGDSTYTKIIEGDIDDWARETVAICAQVYNDSPQGANLSYDYVARWTPVVEKQLLHGGLRLAKVLNDIFD